MSLYPRGREYKEPFTHFSSTPQRICQEINKIKSSKGNFPSFYCPKTLFNPQPDPKGKTQAWKLSQRRARPPSDRIQFPPGNLYSKKEIKSAVFSLCFSWRCYFYHVPQSFRQEAQVWRRFVGETGCEIVSEKA